VVQGCLLLLPSPLAKTLDPIQKITKWRKGLGDVAQGSEFKPNTNNNNNKNYCIHFIGEETEIRRG
jgi:hypothetical protein